MFLFEHHFLLKYVISTIFPLGPLDDVLDEFVSVFDESVQESSRVLPLDRLRQKRALPQQEPRVHIHLTLN